MYNCHQCKFPLCIFDRFAYNTSIQCQYMYTILVENEKVQIFVVKLTSFANNCQYLLFLLDRPIKMESRWSVIEVQFLRLQQQL